MQLERLQFDVQVDVLARSGPRSMERMTEVEAVAFYPTLVRLNETLTGLVDGGDPVAWEQPLATALGGLRQAVRGLQRQPLHQWIATRRSPVVIPRKVALSPGHPERICWGCERYCPANDLRCGNGTIRTPHPVELFGPDWLEHGLDADAQRKRGCESTAQVLCKGGS